mmetsp:Transcript_17835/g.58296  ORF Transcript_17835/g.58296 Transcript_17835/m.58296 type:complete len:218 (-) Transcript_17835:107-760(-)|eukprot:scaffold3035_cov111-Isochrysis_galbana.AAC.7
MLADFKLGRQLRVLRVADRLAVDPDIDGRGDRPDPQIDGPVQRAPRDVHRPAVGACRVVVGAGRHTHAAVRDGGRLALEDVVDVGVDGEAVPSQLPIARHLHLAPRCRVVRRRGEVGRRSVGGSPRALRAGAVCPTEFPLAVERERAAAGVSPRDGHLARLRREERRVRRLPVQREDPRVLPLVPARPFRLRELLGDRCRGQEHAPTAASRDDTTDR